MPLLQVSFQSYQLNLSCEATAIIPQSGLDFMNVGPRKNPDGTIPVLWLLHGMGDNHSGWFRYTDIERYASMRGIAVMSAHVHPQCWYSDMVDGLPYYTFITEEFPAIMREIFPQLSTAREHNYIAGLSMGGYGALKIGLIHPERYGHIGCLSGVNLVEIPTPKPEECDSFLKPMCGAPKVTFGVDSFEKMQGTQADLTRLLDKAAERGEDIPDIFMACGEQDPLLPLSQKFAGYARERLGGRGITHRTGPGGHEWPFWNKWLEAFLNHSGLKPLETRNDALDAVLGGERQ
jgi:putative tributyrin esterase